MKTKSLFLIAFFISSITCEPVFPQTGKIIDHTCVDLSKIPVEYIEAARNNLNVYFGHKSHGAQVSGGGMTAVMNYSNSYSNVFYYNNTGSGGALKMYEYAIYPPETGWENHIRNYLDNVDPGCNVVFWGWSYSTVTSGPGSGDENGKQNALDYVAAVQSLMQAYPDVTFVLSTPIAHSRRPRPEDFDAFPYDVYDRGTFWADSIIKSLP
ncbi:MAG: hypothetical protein HC896_02975 [Bacteroidales bacterium]|nr:hypothetical protein [Bacteroidales bacterium]